MICSAPGRMGNHLKCMVYLHPGNEGSEDHNGVASHSSRVFLDGRRVFLDDVQGNHFSTLLDWVVVDWRISRFLMADVNGEVTRLSEGSNTGSSDHAVVGAAAVPSPALPPPDLELCPLAFHSNLHLEEQRYPRF